MESTRPSVSLAEDNFFMPDSCPFVVSGHEEARAIEMNTPVEENVINLRYYDKGELRIVGYRVHHPYVVYHLRAGRRTLWADTLMLHTVLSRTKSSRIAQP